MKIVIFVFGSRGDVQPGVALGVGLQKQGHQVSLVTHTYFEKFVRQYGLGFWGIPGDVNQLLNRVWKPA